MSRIIKGLAGSSYERKEYLIELGLVDIKNSQKGFPEVAMCLKNTLFYFAIVVCLVELNQLLEN